MWENKIMTREELEKVLPSIVETVDKILPMSNWKIVYTIRRQAEMNEPGNMAQNRFNPNSLYSEIDLLDPYDWPCDPANELKSPTWEAYESLIFHERLHLLPLMAKFVEDPELEATITMMERALSTLSRAVRLVDQPCNSPATARRKRK
jgi:hypothetical protein